MLLESAYSQYPTGLHDERKQPYPQGVSRYRPVKALFLSVMFVSEENQIPVMLY